MTAPSDNELDYKSLVLYYHRASAPSLQLRERLAGMPEVLLVDMEALASRPDWLRGAPTLVELPSNRVHRGSAAIAAADAWLGSQLLPHERTSSVAFLDPLGGAPPPQPDDPRYDAKPSSSLTTMSLEELMRRRAQ